MGVKSTQVISRADAIALAVDAHLKLKRSELERHYAEMDDALLEDTLEALSDMASGGNGFVNYCIE